MADWKCSQCGMTNEEGARFCGGCGTPAGQSISAPAPAPPQAPKPGPYVPGPPPPQPSAPGPMPGLPPSAAGPYSGSTPPSNNRAVITMVLGILSLVCCGFLAGVPAIILGRMELNDIRSGRSAASNETMAKLGFFLGIAGTIISGLVLIGYIVAIVFGIMANRF